MAPTKARKSAPDMSPAKRSTTPPSRRWLANVKTDSTRPAPGLFKQSGPAIAEGLAKKSVSPKGPGQAVRMLNFYENRGGKNLSEERRDALETAKGLLHTKVEAKGAAKKGASKKAASKTSVKKQGAKRAAVKASAKKASK